ncbi:peptide N-acetyl-beta-D-glucosaminyl asparaginase amidase A-domain-containing protein [Cantharellus anzutake]|uniref:peptide N-acetyl-beta-D-glucosaminyl asparaginase amidase A-domain-containing protein n=1 Tax=Cantharellus anzutake TaxID=1750568 RepID=UPI0019077053|nr:peptide N-acetyl-beta-D-glucosaminyl asparaginase amidase A-domain-containing protein [Cantharellus anzutake]KAF8329143.1 peptide N-acetyl-beta-D-glucosaminyl asparaginase amidase A-domain-containing protein [Cantharellus anzutake]
MVFKPIFHNVLRFGSFPLHGSGEGILARAANASVPPLVNFQVQQPPALPYDVKCTVVLTHHLFGNSYYQPAIIDYIPPSNCGPVGKWAGISMNLTGTSNGTQYDRLAAVTFSQVEIWRTSTAEPTKTGIIWTVLKDVSRYMPLFAQPGRMILDLNNIIDPKLRLTGEYDVTLSATFHEATHSYPAARSSDLIIPLSNLSPDQPNYFSVPPSYNMTVFFPTNIAEAYAEIYASGNAQEEFWYLNAADEYFGYIPPNTTYQTGPFREVRVLVDGQLAGVAFPYPVIFTGGILPSLWRPISAYGSLDQPTYKVDLTPFIPVIADGKEHIITLDVASAETKHNILGNWYLSGNIQIIQDSTLKPTKGKILHYSAPFYASTDTSGTVTPQNGYNDVNITVTAIHKLNIVSEITTGSGKTTLVKWSQDLSYKNFQSFTQNGSYQILHQTAFGHSLSMHNGVPAVLDKFAYPLDVIYYDISFGNTTGWYASVDHSYDRNELPSPFIDGSQITTRQYGSGTWLKTNDVVIANGTTTESFKYLDNLGNSYYRDVSSTNSSITKDKEGGTLAGTWPRPWAREGSSGVPRSGAHNGFVGRLLAKGRITVR